MKRHGFFRDITDFAVEDESEGLVTFSAKSNGKFQAIYPFEFEIKNQIEIINDEVVVSYEVTNLDTKQMIFTMGHHPAFLSKKDGVLTFDKTEHFTKDVNDQGLVAEKPDYKFEIQETKIADLSFANSAFYFTQDLKSS
jgi:galactose mutarotase-like enzyme